MQYLYLYKFPVLLTCYLIFLFFGLFVLVPFLSIWTEKKWRVIGPSVVFHAFMALGGLPLFFLIYQGFKTLKVDEHTLISGLISSIGMTIVTVMLLFYLVSLGFMRGEILDDLDEYKNPSWHFASDEYY